LIVDVISSVPSLSSPPRHDGLSHAAPEIMVCLLKPKPRNIAVYVGYATGDLIQVTLPTFDGSNGAGRRNCTLLSQK